MTHHANTAYYQPRNKNGQGHKSRDTVKKKTLSLTQMARMLRQRKGRKLTRDEIIAIMLQRMLPRTRGDCPKHRPCPHVSCKYHLKYDMSPEGSLIENQAGLEFDELEQTCCLDIADGGAITLDAVGSLMGVSREMIRHIEKNALEKLRNNDDLCDAFLALIGDE